MTTRRSFLTGLAGIIAAPAIVRASSLMPVKALAKSGFGPGQLWAHGVYHDAIVGHGLQPNTLVISAPVYEHIRGLLLPRYL